MGDNSSERRHEIQWVENILKPQFFGVIKRRCGESVGKYWVTGVLPAFRDGISPLTATRVISFDEKYQSLCGFTQKDVDAIVSRALHHFPEDERILALKSLKMWYNGYKFCSSGAEIPLLYNPQLVFVHLERWSHGLHTCLTSMKLTRCILRQCCQLLVRLATSRFIISWICSLRKRTAHRLLFRPNFPI
jgi:hypothetical protein